MSKNTELWEKWEKTPIDIIKEETRDGKTFKVVSAIHKIKKATEVLGLYGKKWGLKKLNHSKFQLGNLVMAELDAIFFIEWDNQLIEVEVSTSMAITNREQDGKISFNPHYKSAIETSLLNKSLSRYGLYGDTYADDEMIKTEAQKENDLLSADFVDIGEKIEEGE